MTRADPNCDEALMTGAPAAAAGAALTFSAGTCGSGSEPMAPAPAKLAPADLLLELAAAFLAPMFLAAGTGDLDLARLAALETVAAYGARTRAELMGVAQTVAFGLAVMDNLMVSFAPDISLSMKVRLRSGANGLNRSARQTQQGLDKRRQDESLPRANPAGPAAVTGGPGRIIDDQVSQAEIDAAVERARSKVAEAHARLNATGTPARQPAPRPPGPATAAHPPAAQPAAWPVAAGAVGAEGGVEQPVAAQATSAEPVPGQPAGSAWTAAHPVAAHSGQPPTLGPLAGMPANNEENKLMWASAMAKVAGDVSREESIPAPLWASNRMWANALAHHADHLASGPDGLPQPAKPAPLAGAGALKRR